MNKQTTSAVNAGRKPDPRAERALALREAGLDYSAIAERLFGGELPRAHDAVRNAKNRRARQARARASDEQQHRPA